MILNPLRSISHFMLFLVLLGHRPVAAEDFALLMGIAAYRHEPLPGVQVDLASAAQLAASAGVPARNVLRLQDEALTLPGMRTALRALEQRVTAGDRVFIYFSGHGTAYTISDGISCEQALVTQEGSHFPRKDFLHAVFAIARRAALTTVIVDSCFSAGVIDDVGQRDVMAMLPSKFVGDAQDACAVPSNVTRGPADPEGPLLPGLTLLASAAADELSFMTTGQREGSVATASLLQCLGAAAQSLPISLEHLRACAQQRVDDYLHQHMSTRVTGQHLVLQQGGPQQPAFQPLSLAVGTEAPRYPTEPSVLLDFLQGGANRAWEVTATPLHPTVRIGKGQLRLRVHSSFAGYLTLLALGTSGQLYRVFPNRMDAHNVVLANQDLLIPGSSWSLPAQGPVGLDRLLAIVSSKPDLFARVGSADSIFQHLEISESLADEMVKEAKTLGTACANASPTKGGQAAEEADCMAGYGASRVDIEEVP